MSRDDIEDDSPPEEDAFYEADYDEDTIDYELDADDLLEEEPYPSNPSSHWETIAPNEAPLPNLDPEFELDAEGDFGEAAAADLEPPWSDQDLEAEPKTQEYSEPWPFGLIGAAIVALVLLTAGGYGVVQQRAAMTEEIRQLQAELATTASKQEIADNRQAQRAEATRSDDLQFQIDALQRENQNLQTEIAGLETLLAGANPVAPAPPVTTTKTAVVAPTPAVAKPEPTTNKPVAAASKEKEAALKPLVVSNDRTWFVNFGSYSKEATAKKWASKLKVDKGELIVIPGQKGSIHYFRVRVVDLPNRAIAEKIADQLEKTYKLPKLWVGQQ